MKLDELMKELEKELDLKGLALIDDKGFYTLPLEENIEIKIGSLSEGFSLFCVIEQLPKVNRESFFTQALMGNLFGQGTKGGRLGVSNDENKLTLSQDVEYTVEYEEFRDTVEDFINSVDYWKSLAVQSIPS